MTLLSALRNARSVAIHLMIEENKELKAKLAARDRTIALLEKQLMEEEGESSRDSAGYPEGSTL